MPRQSLQRASLHCDGAEDVAHLQHALLRPSSRLGQVELGPKALAYQADHLQSPRRAATWVRMQVGRRIRMVEARI
jgi:hypothetical protein